MKGPELVFLHIPKAAGTSQRYEFDEYVGTEHVFWIGIDSPPGVLRYPRSRIGDSLVVGGHKQLTFYPSGLDPLYCAILRDPTARAISLFAYYTRPELAITEQGRKSRADLRKLMLGKGIDPDSMLKSIGNCQPFRQEISNYQCSYLSRGKATFSAVLESLRDHDSLIGTVSNYDRFHRELWALLGRRDVTPARVNKSMDNYANTFLQDEELVSLIGELNKEDQKLVDWVENEHRGIWLNLKDAAGRKERLGKLPRKPGEAKARPQKWRDTSGLWPRRDLPRLQWPLNRLMVAEPQRLIYMPIPGAADGVVQRMMLQLSAVPHADAVLQLGIERVVQQFATGLMLADRSPAEIEAVAARTDYFRFAIVYEPVARLIDIYRQNFVDNPGTLSRWRRFDEMLAEARGRGPSGPAGGLTFRQFVRTIAGRKYNHRLWLPQGRYLPWRGSFDRLYRPDQLQRLERDLVRLRGLSVDIANAAAASLWTHEPADARYADTPPGELPADPAAWRNRLVDAAIIEQIKDYYARDFRLYNCIAENDVEEAGV